MANIFYLEKTYADEIIAHALSETPSECCGILAGVDGKVVKLYRTVNIERSSVRYSISPQELIKIYSEIEENSWQLLAIYHSHTHAAAYPSPIDVELAFISDCLYLIVSLSHPEQPVIRAFHIVKEVIDELQLRIV
jgi:[CysO sulfur-carrier protein]-S-L-cysteine hydrolase